MVVEEEEVTIAVEEAGTTEDRPSGEAEEGAELEEVGGEEDGVEEEAEIPDNHQITKTSDTKMTSTIRATGILVIVFNRTGLQEAGEVSSVTIKDLPVTIKIRIKEEGDMDQLALAMIATTSIKHLIQFNLVIQGILRKASWIFCGYILFAFYDAFFYCT